MQHNKFNYQSLQALQDDMHNMGVTLPCSVDTDVLKQPLKLGDKIVPNRLAIQPMEGCDGLDDGKPGELTLRRYKRFGGSGAGLLWFEACAVVNAGRANPRQLMINEENVEALKELLESACEEALRINGIRPYNVLQLTHSGRYSKPYLGAVPSIAAINPYLDPKLPGGKYHLITDAELEQLEDDFVQAAILAKQVGFDAVDIKSCHRYLNSELLSAHTREGKYGGSFENRTRFMLNIIDKIKEKLGDTLDITVRMNAYDAIPYPYGFGVDREDYKKVDLTEPKKLVGILRDKGIKMIDISIGNPYYNPHVGRPYDVGGYLPPEHPLWATQRMLSIIKEIQQTVPNVVIVGSALSWLREYAVPICAGLVSEGWFGIAGFGRQAFAYPDFAKDIIETGKMSRQKCCITCSKCTEIMRDGGQSGCVIKDAKVYAPIYKMGREGKPDLTSTREAEHN